MKFPKGVFTLGRELRVLPHFRRNGGLSGFQTYRKLSSPWWSELGIKTVLDVGANAGQFGLAARLALPHAAIHSFEPLSGPFARLRRLASHHHSWHAHNIALGSTAEKSIIYENDYTPSSSLLTMAGTHKEHFPGTENAHGVAITIERLDEILPSLDASPGILLKVDVQGFEAEVLAGTERALGQIQAMIIEVTYVRLYEEQPLFHDIDNLLGDKGFAFHGLLDQSHSPITGEPLQGDAIYVRA